MGRKRKTKLELKEKIGMKLLVSRLFHIGGLSIETISKITGYPEEKIEKILKEHRSHSEKMLSIYKSIPQETKELLILLINCYQKQEKGNKEIFSKLTISQIYKIIKPHLEKANLKISHKDFYELYTFLLIREESHE